MPASIREALENAVKTAEQSDASGAPAATPAEPAAPAGESAAPSAVDLEKASAVDGGSASPDAGAGKPEGEGKPAQATPGDTEKPAGEQPAGKSDGEGKPAEPEGEIKGHRIDRPPQAWKKEAKGEWAALPLHVRQEIHKREFEINKTLAQSAPDRQLAEQFKQVVTPFMARVQASGVHPIQAAQQLFQADYILATAPKQKRAQFMAKLIKDYDIDIGELDTALVGVHQQSGQGGAGAQPDITALIQQQLSQALAPIMQERQQAALRSQQEVQQSVEQMAVDPKFPYFEDVREDMADLIDIAARKGVALSLEDAYHRAVRMNPETYGQLERQNTVNSAAQQHQQAVRAKVASSSIPASPAGSGGQQNTGDGSLRGAIEAAFGGMRL